MPLTTKKFTTTEYNLMIQAGILIEDDRVELIQGEIIQMSPVGVKHTFCVKKLNRILSLALGDQAILSIQDPIELPSNSQPQPDIALLRPPIDLYSSNHPQPQDIFLLIEVADSTLESDRQIKIPLYAKSMIKEAWIINLNNQTVEIYRNSNGHQYQEIHIVEAGQNLTLQAFPQTIIPLDQII